jgi:phosphate/sulfate permease
MAKEQFKFKIIWPYAIKGFIFAALMMIGVLVGTLMRINEVQGFTIWFVVGLINTITTLIVFYLIKLEFSKKDKKIESLESKPKKSEKETSKDKESPKKEESEDKETPKKEEETPKKEIAKDKKSPKKEVSSEKKKNLTAKDKKKK